MFRRDVLLHALLSALPVLAIVGAWRVLREPLERLPSMGFLIVIILVNAVPFVAQLVIREVTHKRGPRRPLHPFTALIPVGLLVLAFLWSWQLAPLTIAIAWPATVLAAAWLAAWWHCRRRRGLRHPLGAE